MANKQVKSATPEITPEMIAAFLAEKKAKEEAAKKASKKPAKFADIEFHFCTVTGGRKFEHGITVKCVWAGLNKFKQDTARIVLKDGSDDWINPKFLKAVKPMDAAEVARIKAEREVESSEMVLVPGAIPANGERDKSILLNYTGWYSGAWFPRSMITKVGETKDGLGVFEVPAWKVRKDKGPDSLTALRAKQDAIRASIVE